LIKIFEKKLKLRNRNSSRPLLQILLFLGARVNNCNNQLLNIDAALACGLLLFARKQSDVTVVQSGIFNMKHYNSGPS
jgi:hypothetical protein